MSRLFLDPRCAVRSLWALGALTLAAGLLPASAHAATCSSSAVFDGGTSLEGAEYVGTLCGMSSIKPANDETIPRYWSFTWGGTAATTTITGLISNDADDFFKEMRLYEYLNLPNELFALNLSTFPVYRDFGIFGAPSDGTKTATITYSLTPGSNYVVSIETPGEPGLQVNFSQAGATPTVPLPASLPMLGGALAVLGLAHRLRKARS